MKVSSSPRSVVVRGMSPAFWSVAVLPWAVLSLGVGCVPGDSNPTGTGGATASGTGGEAATGSGGMTGSSGGTSGGSGGAEAPGTGGTPGSGGDTSAGDGGRCDRRRDRRRLGRRNRGHGGQRLGRRGWRRVDRGKDGRGRRRGWRGWCHGWGWRGRHRRRGRPGKLRPTRPGLGRGRRLDGRAELHQPVGPLEQGQSEGQVLQLQHHQQDLRWQGFDADEDARERHAPDQRLHSSDVQGRHARTRDRPPGRPTGSRRSRTPSTTCRSRKTRCESCRLLS